MEVILENIRSFAGRHIMPLRPLTVLVGENSSGKSTFLAALSALSDPKGYPLQPSFNTPPYSLGNYDTIATFKGGRFGRAEHFTLGYVSADRRGRTRHAEVTYVGYRGRVTISNFLVEGHEGRISVSFRLGEAQELTAEADISIDDRRLKTSFVIPPILEEVADLPFVFFSSLRRSIGKDLPELESPRILETFYPLPPFATVSIAPIRTKPERTYSEITEAFLPTGEHIPYILERLLGEKQTSRDRRNVEQALERFGDDSGLFREVKIRRLGEKAGAPFQIMVKVAGKPVNLIDVGYGVSQALPVIVQSVLTAGERWLLLQQPEIHLHPRAQASLGTFFADLAERSEKHIVVETHSDFIVDRIRQEVARNNLGTDKVIILFFDKPELETTTHSLEIDGAGNVLNAPNSYRQFMLREEMSFLVRADKG